jgi:hypothetical protein
MVLLPSPYWFPTLSLISLAAPELAPVTDLTKDPPSLEFAGWTQLSWSRLESTCDYFLLFSQIQLDNRIIRRA